MEVALKEVISHKDTGFMMELVFRQKRTQWLLFFTQCLESTKYLLLRQAADSLDYIDV